MTGPRQPAIQPPLVKLSVSRMPAVTLKGSPMRFLLRMAFWLTVILALLPSGGSNPAPKVDVSTVDAVSAAKATVDDMGSFCRRQPDACAIGWQTAVAIGQRAQAGARMLYQHLNAQWPTGAAGAAAATQDKADKRVLPVPSQHTLSPPDLAPAWRGPQPRQGLPHLPGSPPSS